MEVPASTKVAHIRELMSMIFEFIPVDFDWNGRLTRHRTLLNCARANNALFKDEAIRVLWQRECDHELFSIDRHRLEVMGIVHQLSIMSTRKHHRLSSATIQAKANHVQSMWISKSEVKQLCPSKDRESALATLSFPSLSSISLKWPVKKMPASLISKIFPPTIKNVDLISHRFITEFGDSSTLAESKLELRNLHKILEHLKV